MPVHSFIHSLASVGVFPSRAFLPAFVAAVLLRFGDRVPLLAPMVLGGKVDAPAWFVCNECLVILGILSLLELWATKNADVRQWLDQFDGPVKSVMALLTTLGVATVRDADLVRAIQQAGISDGLFGLMAAGTVFFLTSARRSLYEMLTEIDADDSLGVQKLCSWAEDAWVVFGAVMLVVFPLLMILLTAVVFGLLYLWQKAAHAREERLRVRCASCNNPIYSCANVCPACGAANRQACGVNWLGLPKLDMPADPVDHTLRLIAVRRCPSCATRLKQKRPRQTCETCRREVFSDDAQVAAYLRLVQSRLAPTLLICLLLSLVPVVGVVPAIVFYRIHLVSPFRRYVPFGSALLAKWLGRFACFAVLSCNGFPSSASAPYPSWPRSTTPSIAERFKALCEADNRDPRCLWRRQSVITKTTDNDEECDQLKVDNVIQQSEDGSLRLHGSGRRLALPAPRIGSQNGDGRGQDGDARDEMVPIAELRRIGNKLGLEEIPDDALCAAINYVIDAIMSEDDDAFEM